MAAMPDPPLFVLGVSRSGTTLLRVMLDRSSVLAIPDESFFIPQLADRHRGRLDPEAFLDDVRRLPAVRDWGVAPEAVRARLGGAATVAEGIAAIYEAYAELHGKSRWGDKTPMYMQHLGLLDRLFPSARYVHLVRDGRDAALSFLALPAGVSARSWALPRDAAEFACLWRTDVVAARALGREVGPGRYLEVRYEELVADPEGTLRRICDFASLPWEPRMLEYPGAVDVAAKPHQQRLRRAPTPGLRSWRKQMAPRDAARFEAIAGDVLAACGYDVSDAGPPGPGARVALAAYGARAAAWRAAARLVRRTPLWRRRHPPLV